MGKELFQLWVLVFTCFVMGTSQLTSLTPQQKPQGLLCSDTFWGTSWPVDSRTVKLRQEAADISTYIIMNQ